MFTLRTNRGAERDGLVGFAKGVGTGVLGML
jgi:hypothetical protein